MLYSGEMSKKKHLHEKTGQEPRRKTPTFLLELPLVVNEGQARHIRGHLEAARALYNAVLSEGARRLRRMRGDPAWQAARAIAPSRKQERQAAFSALRQRYGFSEYALLLQRRASSPKARGADAEVFRYGVQRALEGVPHHKPQHRIGNDVIGADLGPSSIALVPRVGEASLSLFCEELAPDEKGIR